MGGKKRGAKQVLPFLFEFGATGALGQKSNFNEGRAQSGAGVVDFRVRLHGEPFTIIIDIKIYTIGYFSFFLAFLLVGSI